MALNIRNNTQFINNQFGKHNHATKKTDEEKFIEDLELAMLPYKYMDPENPPKSHELAATIANIKQTKILNELSSSIQRFAEGNKFHALQAATNLQNQERPINYDNSKITFSGKSVECPYEINPLGQNKGSIYTQVPVIIVVRDDKGKEVFRSNKTKKPGKNIFLWDGKDEKGIEQPSGDYRVTITSSNEDWEANLKGSANIESVERNDDGNITLKLDDGKTINLDQVTGTSNVKKKHNIADYISYIGRNILTENILQCAGGSASISYNNDLRNYGDTLVEVLDKQGKVIACGKHTPTSMGQNNAYISLFKTNNRDDVLKGEKKLEMLDSGKYSYKIYLENLDSGKYGEIKKFFEKVIGVEENSEHEPVIITNSGEYTKEDITAIGESAANQNSGSKNDIMKYLGKEVEYPNTVRIDNSDGEVELSTSLLNFELPEGAQVNNTTVVIFDSNGNKILEQDGIGYTAVPEFNELSDNSKQIIKDRFPPQQYAPVVPAPPQIEAPIPIVVSIDNMATLANVTQKEVEKYMQEEFRKGNITTATFNALPDDTQADIANKEKIKKINKAIVYHWNKKDSMGNQVSAGEYFYSFRIDYTKDGDNVSQLLLERSKVISMDPNTSDIKLENGRSIISSMVQTVVS